jgi:hypothetical protein
VSFSRNSLSDIDLAPPPPISGGFSRNYPPLKTLSFSAFFTSIFLFFLYPRMQEPRYQTLTWQSSDVIRFMGLARGFFSIGQNRRWRKGTAAWMPLLPSFSWSFAVPKYALFSNTALPPQSSNVKIRQDAGF